MPAPTIAAIDFGTSNSTIGIMQGGQPRLLPLHAASLTAPTALFYPQGKATPLCGHAAVQAYLGGDPGRFMRGLKGVLGTPLFTEGTQLGTQTATFQTIIGHYLGWLLARAEATLGHPVTHLMLGRPVHFLTNQPEADALAEAQLREVTTALGIPHVSFMAEPLAAAYHYEHTLQTDELALIIDIGGGTADFSILHLGPSRATQANRSASILATHGLRLGGAMLDQALALTHVMPTFGRGSSLSGPIGPKGLTVPEGYYTQLTTWHRIHRMYERSTLHEIRQLLPEADEPHKLNRLLTLIEDRGGHKLMFQIEDAKIALSSQTSTTLNLGWIEPQLTLPLTAHGMAQATASWMSTLTASIEETLRLANTTPAHLSTVFVTGGPSAMPLVQATIRQALPTANIILGDQLTSVGTGLTHAAHHHTWH